MNKLTRGLSLVPMLSKIINMSDALLKSMFNKTCLCFGMLVDNYTYVCVAPQHAHRNLFL